MSGDEKLLAFVAERHWGVLASVKRDGRPHLSNVGYAYDPDRRLFRVSVTDDRVKTRLLRADPHRRALLLERLGARKLDDVDVDRLVLTSDCGLKYLPRESAAGKMRSLAEAAAILARGQAEAEALDARSEAFQKYGEAAILEMLVKVLPEVVQAAAAPLAGVDKMTVISADGAGSLGRSVPQALFGSRNYGAISGAMLARRAADRFRVGPAMIGGWILAAAGTLLTWVIGRPLTGIHIARNQAEADHRRLQSELVKASRASARTRRRPPARCPGRPGSA